MPRRLSAYLVAAWAALAMLAPAFGAEPVFPPGLRIGLEPPGDLKPSTRFPASRTSTARSPSLFSTCRPAPMPNSSARQPPRTSADLAEVKRENFSFRSGGGLLITGRAQRQRRHAAQMDSAGDRGRRQRPHRADQCRSAGGRACGLFRRGGPQGVGQRHVPAGADPRAARHAAVQARRQLAGFRVMKVFAPAA